MKDFNWNLVDSSVKKIIVWGTGKWGKAFLSEACLHDISEEQISFTNSSGNNDGEFPRFIASSGLSAMPGKNSIQVVVAIKDTDAVCEIENRLIKSGFTRYFRYTPGKPDYNILTNTTIFMLHRVSDWEIGHLFSNENMKVSPESLDRFLSYLKSQNQEFVALPDLGEYLQSGRSNGIVFTMDDGYKDNLLEALPVFKKHNVPFTIFVTTDFPEKKAVLWWYALEDLILSHDTITLSNGITYDCGTVTAKEKAFLDIRAEILKLEQTNLEAELNGLFKEYNVDWRSKNDELCLSWNDIERLKKEPLVTIGSHTEHHYNLKQLASSDDVEKDVRAGIGILRDKAGINVRVFAYPYGSQNEVGGREISVLKDFHDIDCACLAYGGTISQRLYSEGLKKALPRIMLTEDFINRTVSDGFVAKLWDDYTQTFGSVGKTSPVSRLFGFDRGTPIDRYYIEQFLSENADLIHGNILEIADAGYSRKFSKNQNDTFHVLTLDTPTKDCIQIQGDLTKPEALPENVIDCFICTQTFNFIYDVRNAIRGAYRLLAENGVLLATVSGISQISRYDMDRWGDYWRFTDLSIRKLFAEVFPAENIHTTVYGNALAATCFLQGLAVEDMPDTGLLDDRDSDYQMTIGIVARK